MIIQASCRAAAGGVPSGLAGYALACRRAGQSVVEIGGTWWREVRPCFFRPLIPFAVGPAGPPALPRRAALGGWQYAVGGEDARANSVLVVVAFPDAPQYSIARLNHSRRWEVRSAARRFRVEPFDGAASFKAGAYPVYLEFQRRTRYHYLAGRVRRPAFDLWVEAEFADPGLVALGAWQGGGLAAVSLSRAVSPGWIYSSFFAHTDALRHHVASLMLHHVRQLAAGAAGVQFVFAGMRKPGAAGAHVDDFYRHRGAEFVALPAVLRVNLLAEWMLPRVQPALWRHLVGDAPGA